MAFAGKIFSSYTSIEIDEQGVVWLIQNHFESDSVIVEMESSSKGKVIYGHDDGIYYADVYDDAFFDEDEDYL